MHSAPPALALAAFLAFPACAGEADLSLPPGLTVEKGEMAPPSAKAGEFPASGPVAESVLLPKDLFNRVYQHVYANCAPDEESGDCCLGGSVPLKNDPRFVSGCMVIKNVEQEGEYLHAVIRTETSDFSMGLRRPAEADKKAQEVTFFHLSLDGKLTHGEKQLLSPTGQSAPEELPASKELAAQWEDTAKALLMVLQREEI